MSCDDYRILIFSYFDKEIDKVEHNKLLSHLETCAECKIYFDELEVLFDSLNREKSFIENETDKLLSSLRGSDLIKNEKKSKRIFVFTPALSFSFTLIVFIAFYLIFNVWFDPNFSTERKIVGHYTNGNEEINFIDAFVHQSYIYKNFDTVNFESDPYFDDAAKLLSDIYHEMIHLFDISNYGNPSVVNNSIEKLSDSELDILLAKIDTNIFEEAP